MHLISPDSIAAELNMEVMWLKKMIATQEALYC